MTMDGGEEQDFIENEKNDTEAEPNMARQFTLRSLLLSKFVLGQTAFNVTASFAGPLLCFALIFGNGGPYAWNSGEVLGPICASPMACSVLALAFAPIGMTDAIGKGWYGPVAPTEVQCLACVLPFLGSAPVWRFGVVRHLALGAMLSCVAIPPAICIARYALGPELAAWTQIWFSIIYISILPLIVIPLGLLGFAVKPNLERVETMIGAADDPRPLFQLINRAAASPKC
mmetsp:Transcript_1026/g.2854  ORF Transcript_1026/g.2854 Transcript_1026/m.2854 type:complete len:230 (-) Transcript_1026:304-993(-)